MPKSTHSAEPNECSVRTFSEEWRRRFPDVLPQFVTPRPDCIIWIGALNQKGYGAGRLRGDRSGGIHRQVYEAFIGSIPDGMLLDHLCRVRSCINPAHLEPVTPHENAHRGLTNATKKQCKRGHYFDAENTYIGPDGHRGCRQCARARRASWSPEQVEASRAAARERSRRRRATVKESADV